MAVARQTFRLNFLSDIAAMFSASIAIRIPTSYFLTACICLLSPDVSAQETFVWIKGKDQVIVAGGWMLNGQKVKYWKYYYPDETLKSEGHFDKTKTGPWRHYYENGKLSSIGNYVNGQKDGYWKTYHPNGKMKSEGHFNAGLRSDWWKNYDSLGILESEGSFYRDKKEGLWKFYSIRGRLVLQRPESWFLEKI
mgnify:FL=1